MTRVSVSIAQKWPLEMSSEGYFLILYSEYILEPVLYYFYLGKEVELVLWLLPESFFMQEYKNVCTFATSAANRGPPCALSL